MSLIIWSFWEIRWLNMQFGFWDNLFGLQMPYRWLNMDFLLFCWVSHHFFLFLLVTKWSITNLAGTLSILKCDCYTFYINLSFSAKKKHKLELVFQIHLQYTKLSSSYPSYSMANILVHIIQYNPQYQIIISNIKSASVSVTIKGSLISNVKHALIISNCS